MNNTYQLLHCPLDFRFSMLLKSHLFHGKMRYLCLSGCHWIHLTQLLEGRIYFFSLNFSLTEQFGFFLALGVLSIWHGSTSVAHHSITEHCLVSHKLNLNGKPGSPEQWNSHLYCSISDAERNQTRHDTSSRIAWVRIRNIYIRVKAFPLCMRIAIVAASVYSDTAHVANSIYCSN